MSFNTSVIRRIINFIERYYRLFFCSFLVPILIWVLLRLQQDGLKFFKTMIKYDLIDRSSASLEGHTGGINHYFLTLFIYSRLWLGLLILCSLMYFFVHRPGLKDRASNYKLALALWLFIPLVLYSAASTKIDWYILPVYPPLAILYGGIFSKALKQWNIKPLYKTMLAVAIVFGVFFYEMKITYHLIKPKDDNIELALRKIGEERKYSGYTIYTAAGHFAKKGTWQQVHLLSGELWCDFKTAYGGLKSFLKCSEKNTLLLIPSDEAAQNYIKDYKLKILCSKKGFYLLSH